MAWARAASAREITRLSATGTPAAASTGLGALLVHGERGGEHAGMGIGDAHGLEQALDAAILAVAAVQGVEADIGPELGEPRGHIAADIEAAHAVALRFERVGAGRAGAERDLPLRRQAAHQHRDVNLLGWPCDPVLPR